MKYLFNLLFLVSLASSLLGCKTIVRTNDPDKIGELYGFRKVLIKGGDFWITTYQKITDKYKPYVFYIEGDGAAFSGKYRISENPTPKKRMFIQLASIDTRPNVVYIGRPCQYTPVELNPKCSPQYWTHKRLSDDSVQAMNDVVNKINSNGQFSLVGFSGGGGIAVLIAARNYMTKDILTIGANLDHVTFTSYHNVPPMIGSLNPIDYAKQIKHIPQIHISGGKDTVVPPFIGDKFVQESSSRCVKQKIFKDISHHHGWNKVWEYILNQPIKCS
jgi:hypothetical protein